MTDFFVSYTHVDTAWAEWIAYVLEEEGFVTIIQAWDFRPASSFVFEMQQAATTSKRTIMVLSPDYLKSEFASSEWAAAFSQDPTGRQLKLLPIMVRECQPEGLLKSIVQIRIIGLNEDAARQKLLEGISEKGVRPPKRPIFPGPVHAVERKVFPGDIDESQSNPPSCVENNNSSFNILTGSNIIQDNGSSINLNISALQSNLKKQPWWVKLALFFTVLILAISVYQIVNVFVIKRNKFLAAIESGINRDFSQYMSSTNVILYSIPDNIAPQNGPQQWASISRIWTRAGKTFESAYADAAKCLEEGTCYASKNSDACKRAISLNEAYQKNLLELSNIRGITINRAPGSPIAPFGDGVVDIPQLENLPKVASSC